MPSLHPPIAGYRDPTRLAWWTCTLLGEYGFMAIAAAVDELVTLQYYAALEAGLFTDEELDATDVWNLVRAVAVGCSHTLVFAATAIVFSLWVHRAACNARSLGAVGLMASPGWMVAHYYIPFINIWKPCVGMGQIWRASIDPLNWRSLKVPPLRAAWWTAWLITVHASFVIQLLTKDASEPEELILASKLWVAGFLLDLPATILLSIVVGEITREQQERAAELSAVPSDSTLDELSAPPPPVD